ncbi:hypothetical protein DXG01_003242 [Tephrocybe rancida]|nr:hypothetical protein DXG01_003242 [Tephrocybe rancida]
MGQLSTYTNPSRSEHFNVTSVNATHTELKSNVVIPRLQRDVGELQKCEPRHPTPGRPCPPRPAPISGPPHSPRSLEGLEERALIRRPAIRRPGPHPLVINGPPPPTPHTPRSFEEPELEERTLVRRPAIRRPRPRPPVINGPPPPTPPTTPPGN